MRYVILAVSLLRTSAGSADMLAPEKSLSARVGFGLGTLAVRADGDAGWHLANSGDVLPEVCLLRTAATDPTRLELPGAVLLIGPNSCIQLDLRRLVITLESGRLFLGPTVFTDVRPGMKIHYSSRNYQPKTDFTLRFGQPTDELSMFRTYMAWPLPPRQNRRGEMTGGAWNAHPSTYFMASVVEESQKRPPKEPADVLILADTSDGMSDQKAVRQAAEMVMRNLRSEDRFRLMCVDVGSRQLDESWLEPDQVEAAMARLSGEFSLGGTNLDLSFKEALAEFDAKAPKRRRLVVYIGDGEDTFSSSEDDLPAMLAAHLTGAKATLCAVLVRKSNRGRITMEALARENGGLVFDLVGRGHPRRELFRWLLAGLPELNKIVNVEIEGATEDNLDYPTSWPAVSPSSVRRSTL